jgi:hypothetical protein
MLDSRLKASALHPAHARVQQHEVVADFLRDFVRDDGGRGHDAQRHALREGGGDQHAIDEIVEGIADQDQRCAAHRFLGTAVPCAWQPQRWLCPMGVEQTRRSRLHIVLVMCDASLRPDRAPRS